MRWVNVVDIIITTCQTLTPFKLLYSKITQESHIGRGSRFAITVMSGFTLTD
jgi:hypothetical protein